MSKALTDARIIQVGVMGSAGGELPEEIRAKVRDLGNVIATCGCVLVTGACPGLPYEAVIGCKHADGLTVGISPALNLDEHVHRYLSPHEHFDVLIYTGDGLMGREVTGIRSCDIVILVGGRSGTLGEFAIAYDEAKLIGVLQGTGGIADHVEEIVRIVNKDTGATLIYDDDPANLMRRLLQDFATRPRKSPSFRHGAG
jgi:uncharacterized protein (TIGR00725 family)